MREVALKTRSGGAGWGVRVRPLGAILRRVQNARWAGNRLSAEK
jgi:hypothetical protein